MLDSKAYPDEIQGCHLSLLPEGVGPALIRGLVTCRACTAAFVMAVVGSCARAAGLLRLWLRLV